LRTFGVADDGSVIGLAATHSGNTIPLTPNRVVVWRPGSEAREIFQAPSVWNAWISADASRALVEVAGLDAKEPHELWWIDVASGLREPIAKQVPSGCVNFIEQVNHQISNDGSRVLFFWPCAASTLWFWEPGAEARPAAHADEGFLSAVLSGDGRVAWALAASGRLLRIPVDGGPIEEVLGTLPPVLRSGYAGSVPGSAMAFTQPGGISPGLRFTASGFDFPVIDDSTHDNIAIQIPWDYAEPPSALVVTRSGDPFELALPLSIDPTVRPQVAGEVRNGYLWIKAAQQDFSALVTKDNPAPAGSTIHAWFYNLGPLDRPVPTGASGPSDPAAVPLAPMGCFLLTGPGEPGRGLEIPFLAYAPGLVGVYQADLTIPIDWPAGAFPLACDSAGKSAGSAIVPVGPAR
jgi:uncharacterized protein (TIGR03437 family)